MEADAEAVLEPAEVPDGLNSLRACKRCGLVKTFEQFYQYGCENCEFLGMAEDHDKVSSFTSAYFDGLVAMMEPTKSWVARWHHISTFVPGMYALDVAGELPDHVKAYCEGNNKYYRSQFKAKVTR